MLRLIVFLVAFLKLLALGKWYPPAYVRDVSVREFEELKAIIVDLAKGLNEVEHQAEATRQKVYRTDTKTIREDDGGGEMPPVETKTRGGITEVLASLSSGDEVPPGLM